MFPKDHFTENRGLRVLNLGNTAYATTKPSEHRFLGVQMAKRLLRKRIISEKNEKHFSAKNVLSRPNRETYFLNIVSATMFPRLRGPLVKQA